MTVEEAKIEKQKLEERITIIIKLFEESTLLKVADISITRIVLEDKGYGHITNLSTEIHL